MLNLVANGPSGYNLTNSLRFRTAGTTYMSRTPASAGNRRTWTLSAWVKVATSASEQRILNAYVDSTCLYIYNQFGYSGIYTTPVFRDPSAWYHVVWVYDTTQATASNRLKIYVNGVQQTLQAYGGGAPTYPVLNFQGEINSVVQHDIGGYGSAPYIGTSIFDGYMAEYNFIDGQALTPSSFGSTNATTGVWQPAKYTGTYGTNGFYLKFSNIALTSGSNTGLGKDNSGNGNYWNTNNISVTAGTTYDAMTDVPTLTSATVANYAVMNPLTVKSGTGTVAVSTSNGNMTWNFQTSGASPVNYLTSGTIGMSSGKWYWEMTATTITATTGILIGITADPYSSTNMWAVYGSSTEYMYISSNGNKGNNNVSAAYGASYGVGDVIGVALDMDAGTLTFYKNNTSQGTAYTSITGTYFPFLACSSSAATDVVQANFGQRPFTYTPPTGYVALNTYNLPTSTIVQGNKYMDATTYTGAAAPQTIVNAAGFKPDLVWTKSRANAYNHDLYDSVRGTVNALYPNLTNAASTLANTLTSFNSNGYTLGVNDDSNYTSGSTAVGWQWQAGQGSSSSNTNGSITSTVSVNATAGFSVVTYTGTGANATVGHGLGVAPAMVITKVRSSADAWAVYHKSTGNTQYLVLNATSAAATASTVWNNTTPTSSVFSIGTAGLSNTSSGTMVAYCWAEIAGFSKFGSYVGNGSADGPFTYLGFRPKFIMIKCTDTAGTAWVTYDTSRDPYNVAGNILLPNSSSAELSGYSLDIISNGFKQRQGGGDPNASSRNYIYAAFAENPFKNSNAR